MSVTNQYSSLGNNYRAQGLYPNGSNFTVKTTANAGASSGVGAGNTGGNGKDSSGGGTGFMSNASQIVGFAGMFDSLAQNATVALDSNRSGVNNQPTVLIEGVLGGQSGTHLQNMWNTGAKTAAAIDYVNKQGGDVFFDNTSSENLLAEHDALNTMDTLNIGGLDNKEWLDFAFDPLSYAITRLSGKRETAKQRQEKINAAIRAANFRQQTAYANAVADFNKRQAHNVSANYMAFGGPVFGYMSDGAIAYDMARDSINAKLLSAQNKGMGNPYGTVFDKGGSLFTDFDRGISFVKAGGSHEENPLGGVPMGMGENGQFNQVEEGESIFKNYVFSKRLAVPKAIRNKYKLRSLNFSDVFEEYFKKNGLDERENDPIAMNGLMAFASDLMMSQEMVKAKKQAKQLGNLFPHGGYIIHDKSKDKSYFDELYADGSDYMNALNWYNDPANVKERDALIAAINAGTYDTDAEKINGQTVTPDTWYNLATDGLKGPVHNAIIANMAAVKAKLAAPAPAAVVADANANAAASNPGVTYQKVSMEPPVDNGLITLPDGRTVTPEEYQRIFGETAPLPAQDSSWTPEGIMRAAGAIPVEDGTYLVPVPNGDGTTSVIPAGNAGASGEVGAKAGASAVGNGNGALSVTSLYSDLGNRYRMAGLWGNLGALAYNLLDPYKPGVVDEIGNFVGVRGTPIGQYVPDFHIDTRYNSNQLAQQAAATKAAIMNTTNPNRNAGLLAADYNAQTAQGDMLIKDAAADYENMLKARTFDRETDKYNSGLALDVAKANMQGRQAHKAAKMQERQFNISNYDAHKRAEDAAIGQGISNIIEWLNANSREKDNLAMVAALRDSGALASNDAMDLLYNYLSGTRPAKKSKKSKNNGEG